MVVWPMALTVFSRGLFDQVKTQADSLPGFNQGGVSQPLPTTVE